MTVRSFLYTIYAIALLFPLAVPSALSAPSAALNEACQQKFSLSEPITASSEPPGTRVGGPSLANGDLLFPGGSVAMSRVLHGGTQNLALDFLQASSSAAQPSSCMSGGCRV
jgi:hypothetical protein